MTIREHFYETNGVVLHCVEAGPVTGPVVLLLHGFPEYWRAWTHQLGPLARAGFRVVAPDLRGYNLSSKPQQVLDYQLSTLLKDLTGLLDALGAEQACVAGHDWGGISGLEPCHRVPRAYCQTDYFECAPPSTRPRSHENARAATQKLVCGFFQLPWLPEKVMHALADKSLQGERPDAYPAPEKALYHQAWKQKGAARGMINYYRALLRYGYQRSKATDQVLVPTLLIWGLKDQALQPSMSQNLERWVPDLQVVRLPHASHWVMRDEPVRVSNLMLNFFGAN